MMTVEAARALKNGTRCFVGIGRPSAAANLARRTSAPDLVLIYESGTIGAKPDRLPLSIGDGVLAETADSVVSVPEIFNYWLQPGRIDVGFLGAGGAPEIAASCREVIVVVQQSLRTFVERLDFITSVGYGDGPGSRERLGLSGRGPVRVITDLGVLEPDPSSCELTLTRIHPGVDLDVALKRSGWELRVATDLGTTEPPTDTELAVLRELEER
jgi:glutaconate CoA-transferase subunit B